jgi:5-methylcytosine-specific restriction endonuclease McrA
MKSALLLNADYSPLHFVSNVRAFSLVYKGRAEIIDMGGKLSLWNDEIVRTPTSTLKLPATIRLLSRVSVKWHPPKFRKSAVFSRDGWQCQYCRGDLSRSNMTIDHVHPRSRGGETSWKNCVASCKHCNRKKANKTPLEAGMPLIKQPVEPSPTHFWSVSKGSVNWHEDWSIFIPRNQ